MQKKLMEKVLIVSGDGGLIEKLRFIFFENYGASDITTVSNPDSCISLASQINPELIVIDTSVFNGSLQEFFIAKNSKTQIRKIPVVLFDKGATSNDVPQLNAVIDASISEYDLGRSLHLISHIQNKYDVYGRKEDVDKNIDSKEVNELLVENQAYMLNEVRQDSISGRYQYKIIEASPLIESIIGLNQIQNSGKSSLEILHGIEDENRPLFDNLPQDKKIIHTRQFYDSNQRYLDVVSFGISDNKIATFVKDITPQNKIEQDLRIAYDKITCFEKLKNTFISNVSHEIRTPMNAIIGFSRLLESDGLDVKKRKHYVSIIQKSGFQLIETLDKLVDLSKIQTHQLYLNQKKIDFEVIFTELEIFTERKLYENNKEENIEFEIHKRSELSSINLYSDHTRLLQIFKELIDNAIKFSEVGKIEIGYSIQGNGELNEFVEFYIKDTGYGMDEKSLCDILKLYVQIDNKAFSKSGLGLGLSISHKLVEMMGGTMRAESKMGEGSCFYFSLPIIKQ